MTVGPSLTAKEMYPLPSSRAVAAQPLHPRLYSPKYGSKTMQPIPWRQGFTSNSRPPNYCSQVFQPRVYRPGFAAIALQRTPDSPMFDHSSATAGLSQRHAAKVLHPSHSSQGVTSSLWTLESCSQDFKTKTVEPEPRRRGPAPRILALAISVPIV